jgi:hypothetical protein
MKITIELPDDTCALEVIYLHGYLGNLTMSSRGWSQDKLKDGENVSCLYEGGDT